jgi:outer membrane protein assembly factor BamB/quinol monooxygenase YgiN/catechol 2,3-dioxygenase-like lactoylglutathione lyase family enzyme/pimeloyl-ACP methyl ester carboxylesterase
MANDVPCEMRRRSNLLILALTVATLMTTGTHQVRAAKTAAYLIGENGNTLSYYVRVPDDYDAPGNRAKYPLIISLHGSGGRGTDLDGPQPGNASFTGCAPGFAEKCIAIAPQALPDNLQLGWKPYVAAVKRIVDNEIAVKRIDTNRIYVKGYSMGSAGAGLFAEAYPDFVAAVNNIAGVHREPTVPPRTVSHIPHWGFIGKHDNAGRVANQVKRYGDSAKARTYARMTLFPNYTHTNSIDPKEPDGVQKKSSSTELFRWMFSQVKGTPPNYELGIKMGAAATIGDGASVDGFYEPGTVRTLTATPPNSAIGEVFTGWTNEAGSVWQHEDFTTTTSPRSKATTTTLGIGRFSDPKALQTTFTMPSNDVVVTANYSVTQQDPPITLSATLGGAGLAAEGPSASRILEATGVTGGLAVHVGCGDGKLTAALRASDSYIVHGLDSDPSNVAAARKHIRSLGQYGSVFVERWARDQLPYIDNSVNLVVSKDLGGISHEEILRVLVPGGVSYVKSDGEWEKVVKPRPAEIDEWTHYLHDPSNNGVAHDSVIEPAGRYQWLGGPRYARHHDHMSSVSAVVSSGGRLFYIFDEATRASILTPPKWRLIARDAFNGVVLWKREIEVWHSHLWPLKSGPQILARRLVAVGDRVYVTLGIDAPLSVLDAASGETIRTYEGTEATEEVLCSDGLLILAVAEPELPMRTGRRYEGLQEMHADVTNPIWTEAPRTIMAVDADSGEIRWEKKAVLVSMSLAADGQRVLFHDGERIQCLDRRNGQSLWSSEPLPLNKGMRSSGGATLVLHKDVVLYSGKVAARASRRRGGLPGLELSSVDTTMFALSAKDGKTLWQSHHHPSGYAGTPNDILVAGTEFIDHAAQDWTCQHWVRGACHYGIMPCNALIYAPQHPCACHLEAKLYGFTALAPGGRTRVAPKVKAVERLEKGPAYNVAVSTSTVSATSEDWPTFRHDAQRSGAAQTTVAPTDLKRTWGTKLGGTLSTSVVAGGNLFVASVDTHTVHALDADTGEPVWSFTTGGRVDSPPTIWQGRVLFGSADGHVYCLNAADGRLVWRYRAAPEDERMMSFGQVESVWPVHDSVLVQNDVLYCVAGRSMFVDGGLRLLRLDPKTGRTLSETILDDKDPTSGENLQVHRRKLDMPVALPDVLSSGGKYVYMRSLPFDLEGNRKFVTYVPVNEQRGDDTRNVEDWIQQFFLRQQGDELHLFCPTGFLDDSLWHRTYWVYGRAWNSGAHGYYQAGRLIPSGRPLVFDDETVYGYGRLWDYYGWTTPLEYNLFAARKQPEVTQAATFPGRTGERIPFMRFVPDCSDDVSAQINSMVLTRGALFAAGPPDVVNEAEAVRTLLDPETQTKLEEQSAAFEGRRGALLVAVSRENGAKLAAYRLDFVPRFDGLIAAGGRLYMTTPKGEVVCLSGAKGEPLAKADDVVVTARKEAQAPARRGQENAGGQRAGQGQRRGDGRTSEREAFEAQLHQRVESGEITREEAGRLIPERSSEERSRGGATGREIDVSKMIAVMVRLHVKPGEEQAVEERMKAFASECMTTEPGTRLYTIIKDEDGLGTMELYEDEDAFKAHGATPHHAESVRLLGDKMSAAPDIKMFEVVHYPTPQRAERTEVTRSSAAGQRADPGADQRQRAAQDRSVEAPKDAGAAQEGAAARIQALVEAGKITQEKADEMIAALTKKTDYGARIEDLLTNIDSISREDPQLWRMLNAYKNKDASDREWIYDMILLHLQSQDAGFKTGALRRILADADAGRISHEEAGEMIQALNVTSDQEDPRLAEMLDAYWQADGRAAELQAAGIEKYLRSLAAGRPAGRVRGMRADQRQRPEQDSSGEAREAAAGSREGASQQTVAEAEKQEEHKWTTVSKGIAHPILRTPAEVVAGKASIEKATEAIAALREGTEKDDPTIKRLLSMAVERKDWDGSANWFGKSIVKYFEQKDHEEKGNKEQGDNDQEEKRDQEPDQSRERLQELRAAVEAGKINEETKHWKFNHVGVIVDDMEKAVQYYKSLGFVDFIGVPIDFPSEVTIDGSTHAVGRFKQLEYTAYGEYIVKDGEVVTQGRAGPRRKGASNVFCKVGPITLELISPSGAVKTYHIDTLEGKGEGINHIAYTVDSEHYDNVVEKMKAKGLETIQSGIFQAETSRSDKVMSFEYVYSDTREGGGFPIELMGVTAPR